MRRMLSLLVLGLGLVAPAARADKPPKLADLTDTVPLQRWFAGHKDRERLLLLLSPK